MRRLWSSLTLALSLLFVVAAARDPLVAHVAAAIPPLWDIVVEDFESGTLDAWGKVSPEDLSLAPDGGRNGSVGLSVAVGQHHGYLYQRFDVTHHEEGYLTFWFDPSGVSIPDQGIWSIPGKSIRIATVMGANWHGLVALRVRRPEGQGYKAYLEWHAEDGLRYDYESGEFDLIDGWQKITLGFHVDEWVAVWVDGVLMGEVTGVTHEEAQAEIIAIGKINATNVVPAGALRYDDVAFQLPRIDDLWVDAEGGDDGNDGLTPANAFRTIQKAAGLAGPGTTVHILPGVYRETVWPALSGGAAEPARYVAEDGPGTAVLRGSEPASSLAWTQLSANTIGLPPGVDPANIYYADLSAWELDGAPRFVVELDGSGEVVARLPLAREPDWQVTSEGKHHEFWWAADGGWDAAGCDPSGDTDQYPCDFPWRSSTQLTDRTDDVDPPGVEPGNLTALGDLSGATLVALDTRQGHYVYRRTIVAHDIAAGRITVDRPCVHTYLDDPGLGWGSKYYVEGQPILLDSSGEWWYDANSKLLYLWPRSAGNPATMNVEISRRDNGFSLKNRSYTILDGLTIEFLNENAIYQKNYDRGDRSCNNTVRNATLRYANRGLLLSQWLMADAPADDVTDGFTLEDSEIAYVDTHAIDHGYGWQNGTADAFIRPAVLNTVIRRNELHHLGFRTDEDNAVGARFIFPHRLRFEGNHVHHVAHVGVQFMYSVVQSPKEYGFAPEEIKTGEVLIKDNVFERACQLATDCAALKISGNSPDKHVFRDLLVTGNVFRDTFGWTYVAEKRGSWTGGPGSAVQGMGGFGLYVDSASGVHAYRNVAYNNAFAGFKFADVWRDGDIVYYNNVAANSLFGFHFGGDSYDTHGSVNTQVVDNIIVNNEGRGIRQYDADGVYENTIIDHNLYYNNGWRSHEQGGLWAPGAMAVLVPGSASYYPTLADIQAHTGWEAHGMEGDPHLWDYDLADHDLHDGSWPDFHLTPASSLAIDRGTAVLPSSLTRLLNLFEADDPHWGSAYDIGRYEGGFALLVDPPFQAMDPGGVARYAVRLHPADLPHAVALTVTSPSPDLIVTLEPTLITAGVTATLSVTDTHAGPALLPGVLYDVPITGSGGGFTRVTSVVLLVGGRRTYLPAVLW